ncbi:MAG: methyltransferase domain-containing protein [Bacteroidota bacterium]
MKPIINAPKTHEEIIRYFEEAGMDYGAWSPNFNMHFGYYKAGLNPFRRESLLDQLNEEVRLRLQLPLEEESLTLDLGCGLGATARYMARRHPKAFVHGLTITPWQVTQGQKLNHASGLEQRVFLEEADFCELPVDDEMADACYAVESACYAEGADKAPLVQEMARCLRKGGRFVIADGFRKHSRPLPGWLEKIYRANLRCWALKDLADIEAMKTRLRKAGFHRIVVEDVSWRIAPSFLHIPIVSLKFLWQQWRKNGSLRLSAERWNNVKAPLLGMLMGLCRTHFSYYLISGQKRW